MRYFEYKLINKVKNNVEISEYTIGSCAGVKKKSF